MNVKRAVNVIIAAVSPFAAAPTGWAIYAGITNQAAFPMWEPAAIIGTVAIIFVDIAAVMLVTDARLFNATLKNKGERLLTFDVNRAWSILIVALCAEISLSLVIVVFEAIKAGGVLVFPIMTGAGAFAFSERMNLEERIAQRDELRRTATKRSRTTSHPATHVQSTATKYPRRCEHCAANVSDEIAIMKKSQSVGGHMRQHHPEIVEENKRKKAERQALAVDLFSGVK